MCLNEREAGTCSQDPSHRSNMQRSSCCLGLPEAPTPPQRRARLHGYLRCSSLSGALPCAANGNLSHKWIRMVYKLPTLVPGGVFNWGLSIANEFSYGCIILSNSRERGLACTMSSRSLAKLDHAESNEAHSVKLNR